MKGRWTGGKQKLITVHTPYMLVRYLGKPEMAQACNLCAIFTKNKTKIWGGGGEVIWEVWRQSTVSKGLDIMQIYIQAISMD